ncbi:DUF5908 family protein [Rhizobacter sp. P5_C2]
MAIEIRQLSVRCRIVAPPPSPRPQRTDDMRVLKEQIFAQCRAWLRDELRRSRER